MQTTIANEQLLQYNPNFAKRAKRDKLILDYLPLVKYVVGKIMICLPNHIDEEDLIEAGILGLIESAEKFNENKQVKFKTYSYHRIRGAVLDYLRLQDWAPRSVREKESLVRTAHDSLEQKLNRIPTTEEIADELNISCKELDKMYAEINLSSLLYIEDICRNGDNGNESKAYDFLKDRHAFEPSELLALKEEKHLMEDTIKQLQPKEKMVIALYYYEDMLLREIAEVMSISESRVSQLHHRALISIKAKVHKSK